MYLDYRRRLTALKGLAMVAACAVTIAPAPATACGGLFCSASSPVNQTAERIVFSDNGDGTITSIVEILYEGPSERFSWVLPIPGVPQIGLSSTAALDRLQAATNPLYQLTTRNLDCFELSEVQATSADFASSGAWDGPSVVSVAASGSLGPYDYEVIRVSAAVGDDVGQLAIDWLGENGYDVTGLGEKLLGEYLAAGLNLVAFRLSKDSDVGAIRPVRLTYTAKVPMIPIRPTAVAATPDMGVMVWVLGKHRAVPTNYLSLELNEALINWFNPGQTYNSVVSLAADEAGGQGFVTEMSDSTEVLAGVIYEGDAALMGDTYDLEQILQRQPSPTDRRNWQPPYLDWDGYREALRRALPVANAISVDDAYDCLDCVLPLLDDVNQGLIKASPPIGADYAIDDEWCRAGAEANDAATNGESPSEGDAGSGAAIPATANMDEDGHCVPIKTTDGRLLWDPERLIEAVEELVLEPMRATQKLFDSRRKFTRFYTTLSADEMTVDPLFDFNPDLPPVSNVHTRERVVDCDDHWKVGFGDVAVTGDSFSWPIQLDDLPATRKLTQLSTSGDGDVLEDNGDEIRRRIGQLDLPEFDAGACTCRVGFPGTPAGVPLSAVGLLVSALALFRLRTPVASRRQRGTISRPR